MELLLSGQTNRMRPAQDLMPGDTAARQARLAQLTAAYAQLHAGAGAAAVAPGAGEEDISPWAL